MIGFVFIVQLCPTTPFYLLAPKTDTQGVTITTNKENALRFATFDEALAVASDITGWGGAQRVCSMSCPASINTPANRIEARDIATCAWHQATDEEESRVEAAAQAIRDAGLECTADTSGLKVSDAYGNTVTLVWNSYLDGYGYPNEVHDALAL